MDQEKLRQELMTALIPLIGGEENLTRKEFRRDTLHITLKDQSLANPEALRELHGVTRVELTRGRLRLALTEDYFEEEHKMADNKKIAQDILAAVGGKENVTSAIHCMTRLRLTLKDPALVPESALKNIEGVLSVVQAGGQHQFVIGQNVPKVYDEFCNITGLAKQDALQENLDGAKEKLTLKKSAQIVMNYISSSMLPMIPAMMGAALCKALGAVLSPDMLGIVAADSNLITLLNFVYDGFFYFLPIMVGFSAAKKMNIPAHMGAYMGGILIAPAFIQMVTDGTAFDILGLNVTMVNYSQSVVPVLLSVAFMGLIYRLLNKYFPEVLTTIFTPFLTLIVTVPVSFLALAPLGNNIANAIGGGIAAFGNATGFFGVAVIGAIWEFLVMAGMHTPVIMTFLVDAMSKGYMEGAVLGASCATWAAYGVALGAFLRLKNKQDKSMAGGFFISGIIGGITEPTLYGLCMKFRRCFISLMIGGFVGGAYMGLTGVRQYVLSAISNFLSIFTFVGGSTANFANGIIGSVLSLVAAAVATYFLGFSKDELRP